MYVYYTHYLGFQYINNGLGLVVASVLKSQEGNFTCVSTNVAGTDSAVIPVFIQGNRGEGEKGGEEERGGWGERDVGMLGWVGRSDDTLNSINLLILNCIS